MSAKIVSHEEKKDNNMGKKSLKHFLKNYK